MDHYRAKHKSTFQDEDCPSDLESGLARIRGTLGSRLGHQNLGARQPASVNQLKGRQD